MSRLRFDHVTKTYPGVRALSEVSFSVAPGSVHALLGENGAGKSTLLKILAGGARPDSGAVLLDGHPAAFSHPHDALAAGVAVIYQELHLAPDLSVAENLFLGHLPARAGWIDRRELARRTDTALAAAGLDIAPQTRVGSLSLAQRQQVEIAKALTRDAQVIAFDEPTSSLSAAEADRLLDRIRTLRDAGRSILYVSHRMDEIRAVCDAATVLRDGAVVSSHPELGAIDDSQLVREMVGREIADIYDYRARPLGALALDDERLLLRQGEIVGLFGLIGAGRSSLLRRLYGDPATAIRAGRCLCPEDRKGEGIVAVRSVAENVNLSARRRWARLGFCDDRSERDNARAQIDGLRIKTPSPAHPIGLLSGGNQQKAILARWLSEDVRVLLLDEPTRGIDIGAKREIYALLTALAEKGVAIVVSSSDLPEVLGICDRTLVMNGGRIVADLPRFDATPERCLALALPSGAERNVA